MIYLVGNRVAGTTELLNSQTIGLMNTPKNCYRIEEQWIWAADNGCFGKGYPSDAKWIEWLSSFSIEQKAHCLFATAPDVVGDAKATLDRSLPWLPAIRDLGYKAALVTQDGLVPSMVPWDDCDAIFIGGTDSHKLGPEAKDLIAAAQQHGKWVHCGRINSGQRFTAFAAMGVDSADGTFLGFGPAINLPKLMSWITFNASQPPLFGVKL